MGTQMIGYGLAGVCRRWLVYPSDMIWPSVLQTSTFLNTMHRDRNIPVGRWTISRYKLFFVAFVGCFVYSFFPQFIDFFSHMDILTLIWPTSKIVNLLFGMHRGLALLPLTLSWQTVVAFLGPHFLYRSLTLSRGPSNCSSRSTRKYSGRDGFLVLDCGRDSLRQEPLEQPIFPHWIVLFCAKVSKSRPRIYDNTAGPFEVNRILTEDSTLDVEAYKKYSPLLQGPRIALAYALSFASISCVLVHAALYEGRTLISRFRRSKNPVQEDVHMRQMQKYSEVPEWWYQALFVLMFALSLGGIVGWPTFLPWWGFIITMIMPIIFIIPIGIIEARSSIEIGLNVITEFVAGYIWPGRPVANTLVKIYGYMGMSQALRFVADLKLGVYMKIPPRAMFRFQIVGTMVSNLTALGMFL